MVEIYGVHALMVCLVVMLAAVLPEIADVYIKGRRKACTDYFCHIAQKLETMGHIPSSQENKELYSWWKQALEAASSDWLSQEELAAFKQAATACGEDISAYNFRAKKSYLNKYCGLKTKVCCGLVYGAVAAVIGASCIWGNHGLDLYAYLFPLLYFGTLLFTISVSDACYRTIPSDLSMVLFISACIWQLVACENNIELAFLNVLTSVGIALVFLILRHVNHGKNFTMGMGLGDIDLSFGVFTLGGLQNGFIVSLGLLFAIIAQIVYQHYWEGGFKRTSTHPFGPALCFAGFAGLICEIVGVLIV